MPSNFQRQKAGRFGTATIILSSGQIGGANYAGGATPLTASGTTSFVLPAPTFKARFRNFSAWAVTPPASAGGSLLARVRKQNNGVLTTVSADIDLTTLAANIAKIAGILSTATEAGLLFNGTSDCLQIDVVSNQAIGTQPVSLVFGVTFELLS